MNEKYSNNDCSFKYQLDTDNDVIMEVIPKPILVRKNNVDYSDSDELDVSLSEYVEDSFEEQSQSETEETESENDESNCEEKSEKDIEMNEDSTNNSN